MIETIDGPTLYAKVNAERLRRQQRKRHGGLGFPVYTWQRVSRETGVSTTALLTYKNGQYRPSAATVERLLTWLGEVS